MAAHGLQEGQRVGFPTGCGGRKQGERNGCHKQRLKVKSERGAHRNIQGHLRWRFERFDEEVPVVGVKHRLARR